MSRCTGMQKTCLRYTREGYTLLRGLSVVSGAERTLEIECREGGSTAHSLCSGDVPPARVRFFTLSLWEGCCFSPTGQQSGKECVLIKTSQWNCGKGCHFTIVFWEGWNRFVWKGKGPPVPPWAIHPYPSYSQQPSLRGRGGYRRQEGHLRADLLSSRQGGRHRVVL